MLDFIADLFHAHRKAIVAFAGGLAIQLIGSDAIDWIVLFLTGGGVVVTSNDQGAKARIYRRRR